MFSSWLNNYIFPAEVQRMGELLPMTHTLRAMRLTLLADAPIAAFGDSLLFLGGFAAVGIPAALLWFRFALGRARVSGSLAKY